MPSRPIAVASTGALIVMLCATACGASGGGDADRTLVTATLEYRAPADGHPAPNFSPKGTQVALTALGAGTPLPEGAAHPARTGVMQIGPEKSAWLTILATTDATNRSDLARLFLDRNRNGSFLDDGPGLTATPTQNAKTKAWWSSFNRLEVTVPYGNGQQEPYLVNVWIVREGDQLPGVLRYSRGSWRAGTVSVQGVAAVVAAMDANNDAVFTRGDDWSVIAAGTPDAAKTVLSSKEARATNRMMFLDAGAREIVLEFESFSPDGRLMTFRTVDRMTTKAEDRAGDDPVTDERARARATTPVVWAHSLDAARVRAVEEGRNILIDFETSWCGPCKTMDEWIWTDAEVASLLGSRLVGVKLDGDVEKALVAQYGVKGYPTILLADGHGQEIRRVTGYQNSKAMVAFLR